MAAKETPKPLAREETLWFFVRELEKVMRQRWSEHLAALGITPPQYEVLHRLFERDGLTQTELAGRCNKDAPTVTGVIDRLERDGFVRRSPHPDDRRAHIVALTEQGAALRDALPKIRAAMQEQALAGMSRKEFDQLKSSLRKAAASFTAPRDRKGQPV